MDDSMANNTIKKKVFTTCNGITVIVWHFVEFKIYKYESRLVSDRENILLLLCNLDLSLYKKIVNM